MAQAVPPCTTRRTSPASARRGAWDSRLDSADNPLRRHLEGAFGGGVGHLAAAAGLPKGGAHAVPAAPPRASRSGVRHGFLLLQQRGVAAERLAAAWRLAGGRVRFRRPSRQRPQPCSISGRRLYAQHPHTLSTPAPAPRSSWDRVRPRGSPSTCRSPRHRHEGTPRRSATDPPACAVSPPTADRLRRFRRLATIPGCIGHPGGFRSWDWLRDPRRSLLRPLLALLEGGTTCEPAGAGRATSQAAEEAVSPYRKVDIDFLTAKAIKSSKVHVIHEGT